MATVVKLPSGSYRAQIRRAGIYRAATFTTRREAEEWAASIDSQARGAARHGVATPPRTATLATLLKVYREDHPCQKNSSKDYILRKLDAELGHIPLARLNAAHVRDYVQRQVRQGLGGSTIAGELSTLSALLRYGRTVRLLDLDPGIATDARAALASRGLRTTSTERDREPTDDELERLYTHWRQSAQLSIPMERITRLLLATAMRRSELLNLRIDDVNLAAKTALIRDRKDPRRKVGNNQLVPLVGEAPRLLAEAIGDRTEGRVFPGFATNSVSVNWLETCKLLGIEDLHLHDLRHRACRELFAMGLSIPEVALISGHKKWEQLRRYTNLRPADIHRKLDA